LNWLFGGGGGPGETDDRGNESNVQYKPNQNCRCESPHITNKS
jgi:hypothetical protein